MLRAPPLQCAAGDFIVGVAASRGSPPYLIAYMPQLLNEVVSNALSPSPRDYFHADVAIRWVVVVQHTSGRHHFPVHLDNPIALRSLLVGFSWLKQRTQAAQDRSRAILEEDVFD